LPNELKPKRINQEFINLASLKMALSPLNEEGDLYFLRVLRDELEGLKKRLKHEIIQKLQLIQQIKSLRQAKAKQ